MKKLKQKLRNQSLKSKWMLAVGATIIISYAMISIILYFSLQTWLLNNEEKNAQRTVDDVTTFFESQGPSVTIQQLQKNTALMKAIVNQEQTVRIFNLDGVEIIRINDVTTAAPLSSDVDEYITGQILEIDVAGTHAIVINKIVQIGPFQGIMQLVHPLVMFDTMVKNLMLTLLLIGVCTLLFAISISYYLANALIKPITALRDAMVHVREEGFVMQPSFDYQLDDEIGDLLRIYQSMMDELEISFTQQQQFVADASHELRTPIQVIEGNLALLRRWGKDDPEILDESLATILEEITRMKKLIEELLQLARRENAEQGASTDIIEELQKVENELQLLYPQTVFNRFVVGQPVNINVSTQALGQIFRNIIENGIRYNETVPHIKVTIHYSVDNIYVQIEDNGIGISEEHLPYIFDRFYRVDEARTQTTSGTGLGLSITKMLANKYNIEIEVKSTLYNGTTFLLQFPLI